MTSHQICDLNDFFVGIIPTAVADRASIMVFRCIVLLLLAFVCAHGGVLEDYVNRYDPHYTYEVLKDHTYRGPDYTLYVLNMTSQKWKDGKTVLLIHKYKLYMHNAKFDC